MVLLVAMILTGLLFPSSLGTPVPNAPASCDVEPRTVDELRDLSVSATPATGHEMEPYFIAESALPVGEPASDTKVEEITRLLTVRAACLRDLDALRYFALYTDRYLVDLFAFGGFPDDWLYPDEPFPAEPPDYRLGAVERVQLLVDGSVSAFVTHVGADIEDSYPAPGVTSLMIFTQVGGGWRIDRQYQQYVDARGRIRFIADLLDDVATPAQG